MDQMATPTDQLNGYYFEDLEEGMTDVFAKTITDADIIGFAGVSGDTNPLHLNHEFASGTIFKVELVKELVMKSPKILLKIGDTSHRS